MAARPPSRFVVQSVDLDRVRKHRVMLLAGWIGSVLAAVTLTWLLANHVAPAAMISGDRAPTRKMAADTEELRQQVANLTRADQVAAVAATDLRRTLADRDEQISGLRNDLAFYSRLVGGGQQQDLAIQDARVTPIGATHAWDVAITLTQNAKRGVEAKGRATLAVEGLRYGKVVLLAGSALGDAAHADGLPFSFKYFQQLHATMALPADFKPVRLRIGLVAEGQDPASRTIAWTDASQPAGDTHVQQ
jgi:hypothetical protein